MAFLDDPAGILIAVGAAALASFLAFLLGKISGSAFERSRRLEEGKSYEKRLSIAETGRNELQREIEELRQLNEKYLYFVVRIPETVKQLNSTLTFDETVASIIRFTKDILNTDCIELYLFDPEKNRICLEAAYGSNRRNRIELAPGEGLVGRAAERKIMVAREPGMSGVQGQVEKLAIAAPVLFKQRLIGVLGIGRVLGGTGDERRLLAMVADLAGVSLQNSESLTAAQAEAHTDGLTGLFNRRYFGERSLEDAQKAISYGFPISFFLFDIDHFKKYNDRNGHAEGDQLLREMSRLLRENSRGSDVVARYGGEEFIVMLSNTDKKGAMIYAEKIRRLIEAAAFRHREHQPLGCVSISGGVATFPDDFQTIDETVKAADRALYQAKEAGRNRVIAFAHERLT